MPALVAGIHVLAYCKAAKTWMPGIKPGMTRSVLRWRAQLDWRTHQPTIAFEQHGMGWWYIGPRTEHISRFSRKVEAHQWLMTK